MTNKIDAIRDALSVLENIEDAKAELVKLIEQQDSLRGSNERMAKAEAAAERAERRASELTAHASEEAVAIVTDAKKQADEILAHAHISAAAIEGGARELAEKSKEAVLSSLTGERVEIAHLREQRDLVRQEIEGLEAKRDGLRTAIAELKAQVSGL